MATTTNDGSTFAYVSGSNTWATTANAYDGSATTYTTLTTTTAGNHVFDVGGYSFSSVVGANDTLTSVVVNVSQYVSNAARWNNPTIQAYDGATAIGSAATLTERTSAGNENVTITGITLAQVRSATFKLRFTAAKAGTTSAIQYFGWANVTVTYTPYVADRTGTVTGLAPATSGVITSPDKGGKGTVTGLAPATSGTITDTTQRRGTVTGTATASGTVTGTKQEANNDKTGTVTGSATASGTVAGTKKSTGTVVGSATASGTVTGSENSSTTITGEVTASGTATGTAARAGAPTGDAAATGTATGTKDTTDTADGSATVTGTVTGTAYDPDAPVVTVTAGGGGRRRLLTPRPASDQRQPVTVAPVISRTGIALGTAAATGSTRGRAGRHGATVIKAAAAGQVSGRAGRISARTTSTARTTGSARGWGMNNADLAKRQADDDELFLLI